MPSNCDNVTTLHALPVTPRPFLSRCHPGSATPIPTSDPPSSALCAELYQPSVALDAGQVRHDDNGYNSSSRPPSRGPVPLY